MRQVLVLGAELFVGICAGITGRFMEYVLHEDLVGITLYLVM